jgi:hypothetical protein
MDQKLKPKYAMASRSKYLSPINLWLLKVSETSGTSRQLISTSYFNDFSTIKSGLHHGKVCSLLLSYSILRKLTLKLYVTIYSLCTYLWNEIYHPCNKRIKCQHSPPAVDVTTGSPETVCGKTKPPYWVLLTFVSSALTLT